MFISILVAVLAAAPAKVPANAKKVPTPPPAKVQAPVVLNADASSEGEGNDEVDSPETPKPQVKAKSKEAPLKLEEDEKTVEQPPKDSAGKIIEYRLTDKTADYIYVVRTGISLPATLEFPEKMSEPPLCGDCVAAGRDATKANALFSVSGKAGGNKLVIKPAAFPQDIGVAEADFMTSLTVTMPKRTLAIRVEFTSKKSAVTDYVRWRSDTSANETKYVADAKKKLQEEYAEKVKSTSRSEWLRQHLQPHRCRSGMAAEKRVRKDHVVLWLKEVCRYGDYLVARFVLENRSKIPFLLGAPQVGPQTKNDADFVGLPTEVVVDAQGTTRSTEESSLERTVEFNEKLEVAVGLVSRESPVFSLRVPELREADGRTLVLRDITF